MVGRFREHLRMKYIFLPASDKDANPVILEDDLDGGVLFVWEKSPLYFIKRRGWGSDPCKKRFQGWPYALMVCEPFSGYTGQHFYYHERKPNREYQFRKLPASSFSTEFIENQCSMRRFYHNLCIYIQISSTTRLTLAFKIQSKKRYFVPWWTLLAPSLIILIFCLPLCTLPTDQLSIRLLAFLLPTCIAFLICSIVVHIMCSGNQSRLSYSLFHKFMHFSVSHDSKGHSVSDTSPAVGTLLEIRA